MGWSTKTFQLVKIETLTKNWVKSFLKGAKWKIIFRQGDLPAAVDDVGNLRHDVHQHRHDLLQRAPVLWILEGWPTEGKKGFSKYENKFQDWIHPHLFPWLLPLIQMSLTGSIWWAMNYRSSIWWAMVIQLFVGDKFLLKYLVSNENSHKYLLSNEH